MYFFILTIIYRNAIFFLMNEKVQDDILTLQKDLQQARKELSILYEVSNALRTTLELDHILYIILTGVTSHAGLSYNRAILFLVNESKRTLDGKMMIGPESGEEANRIWTSIANTHKELDDLVSQFKESQEIINSPLNQKIQQFSIPLNKDDGGLMARAYFQDCLIHVPPEAIEQYIHDPLSKIFKTHELVIVPLKAKDKINGIIVADNLFTQKPITAGDLRIFEMLANQAGLAIENSRLYEMVVFKSHTDSLTGLWNHGYFQNALSGELEKASRHQTAVSLLMVDIDDFKKLNDLWGHHKGDVLLHSLAQMIRESARESDIICRYGGEEFAVILPATVKDHAYTLAERLRIKIQDSGFRISPDNTARLTISIGVAAFPEHTQNKEDLIVLADKAMYSAKFSGKNTTNTA